MSNQQEQGISAEAFFNTMKSLYPTETSRVLAELRAAQAQQRVQELESILSSYTTDKENENVDLD